VAREPGAAARPTTGPPERRAKGGISGGHTLGVRLVIEQARQEKERNRVKNHGFGGSQAQTLPKSRGSEAVRLTTPQERA
jgi:hypothetical protein